MGVRRTYRGELRREIQACFNRIQKFIAWNHGRVGKSPGNVFTDLGPSIIALGAAANIMGQALNSRDPSWTPQA